MLRLVTFLFLVLISFNTVSANNSYLQWLDIDLSNDEYPYPVEYMELNVLEQVLKMAYMDVKPDYYYGKNILLFHGRNVNGAYWGRTIKALSEQGYQVIVPDQIGFGKSSKPEHFHYTIQQLALNTKAIQDKIGVTKTAVLGHSSGGMLATRFTLMFPETTEKLILENPIGLEDWKLKVPYRPVEWW